LLRAHLKTFFRCFDALELRALERLQKLLDPGLVFAGRVLIESVNTAALGDGDNLPFPVTRSEVSDLFGEGGLRTLRT